MAPNTTTAEESVTQQFQKLDLKKLAREKGNYHIYPKINYPPLEPFKHDDPGHRADPNKTALLSKATKVFDVTPAIGTEIEGIQLSQLTDEQKNDLALLAAERGVVFFRKQDMDPYQAVEFGKYFGRLHIHNYTGFPEGLPEVITLFYDETDNKTVKFFEGRNADEAWHSDITYEEQPAGLTFLKIDTLPPSGGDTLWSSCYEAYDRLSEPMKKFLEGLEALHTGEVHRERAQRSGQFIRREFVDSVHPVVRTHPVTGWKGLFVQPGFTKRIVGLHKRESDLLLKFLFQHIAGGHGFQLRFKWEEDTIAVWDNRCVNHCAIWDYFEQGRRHGWRVTPCAERPYFDPNSKSRKEELAKKKQQQQQK